MEVLKQRLHHLFLGALWVCNLRFSSDLCYCGSRIHKRSQHGSQLGSLTISNGQYTLDFLSEREETSSDRLVISQCHAFSPRGCKGQMANCGFTSNVRPNRQMNKCTAQKTLKVKVLWIFPNLSLQFIWLLDTTHSSL